MIFRSRNLSEILSEIYIYSFIFIHACGVFRNLYALFLQRLYISLNFSREIAER